MAAEEKQDEIITFDEILEDPVYKAEFDRRVTKALSTVQKKLDKALADNTELQKKVGTGEDGDDIDTLRQQVQELRQARADRDYDDAVAAAIEAADEGKGLKFTSKSAREAFMAGVKKAGLELKDGALEGFEDFVAARRKADPEAFKADDGGAAGDKKPAKPAVKFTRKVDDDGKAKEPMTRDKIMAMTDRAARRKAIAENRELFETNKED